MLDPRADIRRWVRFKVATATLVAALFGSAGAFAQPLPTGQTITPTAAPGSSFQPLATKLKANPGYVADGASAIALSPNGKLMLVLTSGFNVFNGADSKRDPALSKQYVLVFDVSGSAPRRKQTLTIPNSFGGIAWKPDGSGFVVGGGVDDTVQVFRRVKSGFAPNGRPISLGHKAGLGADVKPQTGGLAVSPSGARVLVANYYNDSVSLIDLASPTVLISCCTTTLPSRYPSTFTEPGANSTSGIE